MSEMHAPGQNCRGRGGTGSRIPPVERPKRENMDFTMFLCLRLGHPILLMVRK